MQDLVCFIASYYLQGNAMDGVGYGRDGVGLGSSRNLLW
jgi:hypothetical protein